MDGRVYYEPPVNGVERLPTELQMFHASPLIMRAPHWHAQVEVNFIVRGWAHYKMSGHETTFYDGDLALFWGGQPHWLADGSEDLVYAGGHLPLVHFFRLRLPPDIQARLRNLDLKAVGGTSAEAERAMQADSARWAPVVNKLGLKME